jgi:serine/threonine-protein kinase
MVGAGTTLGGRYLLQTLIASGGMGAVWRGDDTVLGRTVAVKVLLPGMLNDPGFAARFRTEARTMAALSHPGIVDVYDYGQTDGTAYLVMRYIDGESLRAMLDRLETLPVAHTMSLVAQIAGALHAAHVDGVIHRDVKPGNLLILPDGRAVLTDFGIARVQAGDGLTDAGAILGTASYVAPEQVTGALVTPAADVYALGVMAFECLTGHRPFEAGTPMAVALKHVHEDAPNLPPHVPPAARQVVARALAKDPTQRWPSAAAMAEAARAAGQAERALPAAGPATRRIPPTGPRAPGRAQAPAELAARRAQAPGELAARRAQAPTELPRRAQPPAELAARQAQAPAEPARWAQPSAEAGPRRAQPAGEAPAGRAQPAGEAPAGQAQPAAEAGGWMQPLVDPLARRVRDRGRWVLAGVVAVVLSVALGIAVLWHPGPGGNGRSVGNEHNGGTDQGGVSDPIGAGNSGAPVEGRPTSAVGTASLPVPTGTRTGAPTGTAPGAQPGQNTPGPTIRASASVRPSASTTSPAPSMKPMHSMPDVMGLTEDAARQKLESIGLVVDVQYQKTQYNCTVVKQTPASGTPVATGSTVTVIVGDALTACSA